MLAAFAPFQTWLSLPASALAAIEGRFGPPVRYAIAPTAYGRALVAIAEGAIRAIALGSDDDDLVAALRRRFPGAREAKGDPLFWDAGLEVFLAIEAVTLPERLPPDAVAPAFERAVRGQLHVEDGRPVRRSLPALH